MTPSPPLSAQNLLRDGHYAEALLAFEQALAQQPDDPQALFGRATALKLTGRLEEARAGFDAVLARMPEAPGALNNRGEVLNDLGRSDEALADFSRALALKPDFIPALLGRGIALQKLHRLDEALADFERVLAAWPDSDDAFFHRGLALAELGRPEEALASYDQAIALAPYGLPAINNRSVMLMTLRRFAEAAQGYQRLEDAVPGNPVALNGLALAALHSCDWSRAEEFREKLAAAVKAGHSAIQPGTMLGYSGDEALLQACARNAIKARYPAPSAPLWQSKVFSGAKIKLAYCSADFHSHATARLMAELFEAHDRSRFEIFGISFGPDDASPMRRRVAAAFDQFHDVRDKSDSDSAALIVRLGIDIAVDLKGLTADARTGIFALRPAPVQVNYLGYPGTMGAAFMDFIIGDPVVTPIDEQPFFDEKIMALPDCYQANDTSRVVLPAPTRAAAGLPPDGFVFCCFNNNWKITEPVFAIWLRLLAAVPGSLLWLIEDSREAADNLRRSAAAQGMADRLVFAPRVTPEEHLARHPFADIFLDTLPYNAHTTASDALWTGVPMVTCGGASFAGRVGASLLTAIGLPELIAENAEDYEKRALALARDPARLAALKVKLAENRKSAPLFDTARFTRNLEAVYEKMRADFLKR